MAKITMAKLDEVIKHFHNQGTDVTFQTFGEPVKVEVKTTIPAEQMQELVLGVVRTQFGENEETGELLYLPELRELALAANVLHYYTNLKDDVGNDRLVEMLYNTGIYSKIVEAISFEQYSAIKEAADARVEWIKAQTVAGHTAEVRKMLEKLDTATEALNAMTSEFANVDEGTMSAAIERLANIPTKDLVKVVSKDGKRV